MQKLTDTEKANLLNWQARHQECEEWRVTTAIPAPTTPTKANRGVDWVLVAYMLLFVGAVGFAVAVRVGWV